MQVIGASLSSTGIAPVIRCCMTPQERIQLNIPTKSYSVSTGQTLTATSTIKHEGSVEVSAVSSSRKLEKNIEEVEQKVEKVNGDYDKKKSLKDYFEESKALIEGGGGGGPPRWFSPLECGSCLENSPLLLYLPGLDGVGLGLIRHHHNLGKIFDIWCLHIPVKDRTSFTDLVIWVERTVRTEKRRSPNRPIYLVGESIGACIALTVAARNPDTDLVLIVSNPASSFEKSQLQALLPILELIPDQLPISPSFFLSLMTGVPLRLTIENMVNQLPHQLKFEELAQDVVAMSSYLSVLGDILPRETLLWKLQLFKSASAYTSARIHAVKAQTLIIASGKDQLLPSEEEGERLYLALPKGEIRKFANHGHFLFLEDGIDLVTVIKGTYFYRRGKVFDPVSDFIPPTPHEFKNLFEKHRLLIRATSPVMLSTFEDGKIVKGLAGIPSEGPVLYVGNHMLLGLDLAPILAQFWLERNILLRGIAHPSFFIRLKKGGYLPPLSDYDEYRIMGAVLLSGTNMYKLLSAKSHVLLYPGGMREANHRMGEQYKLVWPEQSEFVRMASRFGAKIVPFGTIGEDDLGEVVFDYDEQIKIPFVRDLYELINSETVRVRTTEVGDNGNQLMHMPGILPKFPPGRYYYYFGKPIETKGRKQELRDKDKAHELYLQVKSEVENCLAFLKEKRETDPYRNIFARLAYQATHVIDAEVPTFDI